MSVRSLLVPSPSVRSVAAVLAFLLGAVVGVSAQEGRSYVEPLSAGEDASAPPYSGAVRTGNTLFVSGSLGTDEEGRVPADPREEARLALDTMRDLLEAEGFTMDDLVQVRVYCTDLSLYDAWNEVYRTYFTREFPSRAFIGAGSLLAGARFEVAGIAVRR